MSKYWSLPFLGMVRLALQIQLVMAQSNKKKILAGTILIWNLLCRMTIATFASCIFFLRIKKLTILEKNRLKKSIKENGGQIAFGLNQEVCVALRLWVFGRESSKLKKGVSVYNEIQLDKWKKYLLQRMINMTDLVWVLCLLYVRE